MNNSGRLKRILFISLPLLGVAQAVFILQATSLNARIQEITEETRSIEHSTVLIKQTLPALQKNARQVQNEVLPALPPQHNPAQWCDHLVRLPHLPETFQRAHIVREKPDIPIEMELPRELRDAGQHLHPALVPFQIEVKIQGMLDQIAIFIQELDRYYPQMVVSKIDFFQEETSGIHHGKLVLSFPNLQYSEDLEDIHRFADSPNYVQFAAGKAE